MDILLQGLSDSFINISAGWFGAAFILPMTVKKFKINWQILTINVVSGILTFIAAILIRNFI